MAGSGQKFRLRWDGFRSRLSSVFDELRNEGELLDVTLCCDGGHTVKAHRILLSASSPCLRQLLKEHPCQHPVFFLKDTSAEDLKAIIEFVYNGEVNVVQSQLASFIKTAELLQIRGLSGDGDTATPIPGAATRPTTASTPPPPPPPPPPDPPRSSSDTTGGGQPPAKRRRNSGSGADSAPVATGDGAAGASGVIKTEQMDLSDAESAGLEDPLACISSYEDRHHSGSTAGPSSQRPVDSAASAVVLTPQGTGRGNAAGDQSAGPSGAAGTSHGAASLQGPTREVGNTHLQGEHSSTRSPDLNARIQQRYLSAISRTQPQMRTRGGGLPPTSVFREPQLDASILPAIIQQKLKQQIPLDKADWRHIMECIHSEFKDSTLCSQAGWSSKLAVSMVAQFPYLYKEMGLHPCIDMVKNRILNKFKNRRKLERARTMRSSSSSSTSTSSATVQERQGTPREELGQENVLDLDGPIVYVSEEETPDLSEFKIISMDEDSLPDPLGILPAERSSDVTVKKSSADA